MKRQTLDEFIQQYGKDPESPTTCVNCGTQVKLSDGQWRDYFGAWCSGSDKHGPTPHEAKKTLPVIEVEPGHENWPAFVVKAGDKAAVVQFMNVGEGDNQHLCVDVHPFVDDKLARASAFGMEVGRRLNAFTDADANGTSQGLPGAQLVAVLVGKQVEAG